MLSMPVGYKTGALLLPTQYRVEWRGLCRSDAQQRPQVAVSMGASGCRVKQDGCVRMASTPRDTALNNCEYSHTQLILTRMLSPGVRVTVL